MSLALALAVSVTWLSLSLVRVRQNRQPPSDACSSARLAAAVPGQKLPLPTGRLVVVEIPCGSPFVVIAFYLFPFVLPRVAISLPSLCVLCKHAAKSRIVVFVFLWGCEATVIPRATPVSSVTLARRHLGRGEGNLEHAAQASTPLSSIVSIA
ncbi:hypothetical protein L249_8281 [Ophiocordyceps polyrhachis-furcata BCC 54312]|uniref:Secreted protein n=1 Tax=Ophiocordyceps polyrhachis-furcata BCC 54312 TaxID=1330021 RepID=A0A367LHR7_9HYPO|nr:hypothetical protein L249_8281 [Ophiocordyceps polyrhachis-furcata BCC 54312]